jgi:hypothetical protein
VKITDCGLLQGMAELSNREMDRVHICHRYLHTGMGHRVRELAKPTRSPRAFLICMIGDRHCAIAVIVHEPRYTFRRSGTTGRSWKIDPRAGNDIIASISRPLPKVPIGSIEDCARTLFQDKDIVMGCVGMCAVHRTVRMQDFCIRKFANLFSLSA